MATAVNNEFVLDWSELWKLLPKRLPGVVSDIWSNGRNGRIRPLIRAYYPDGQPLEAIFSRGLEDFSVDERVAFWWKPAAKYERDKAQQPDLIEAISVEDITAEVAEALVAQYHDMVASDIQGQLKRAIQEYEEKLSNLDAEINDRAGVMSAEERERLRKLIAENEAMHSDLDERKANQDNIVRDLVLEAVAKRQIELDKLEAELNQRTVDLNGLQAALRDKESDLKASRKALAVAEAQFDKEGGKAYIDFVKAVVGSQENEIRRLSSSAEEFNPDKINRSLAQRGYRTSVAMIQRTVVAALAAWSSGQFVVLSGSTGVGKTQLVRQFAQIVGAGHGVVPVRPSWVDPSDLLGFYNPMQKLFEPTPFLDQVAEAAKWAEANRLFALCLDEMNLSRIENYAADLLSRIERAGGGEEVYLDLYSGDVAKRMAQEQRALLDSAESLTPESRAYLHALTSQLDRYKGNGRLRWPHNLMMFGTVNVDETTQLFSPKFLDRSYVIRFEPISIQTDVQSTIYTGQEINPIWPLPLDSALDMASASDLPTDVQIALKDFSDWQTRFLASFGVHFGHRFYTSFRRYMAVGHRLGLGNQMSLADEFFLAKIPPRIRFGLEEKTVDSSSETKLGKFEQWISALGNKYPSLQAALGEMNSRAPGRGVVEFWD